MRANFIKILVIVLVSACIEESPIPFKKFEYVKVIDAFNYQPIDSAVIEYASCNYYPRGWGVDVGFGPPCCRIAGLDGGTKYYSNSKGYAKINRISPVDGYNYEIKHIDYLQIVCASYNIAYCKPLYQYITSDTAYIEIYRLYPKAGIKFTYKGNYDLPDSYKIVVSGSTGVNDCKINLEFDPPLTKTFVNYSLFYPEAAEITFRANRDTTFNGYAVADRKLDLIYKYNNNSNPIYNVSLTTLFARESITNIEIPTFKN